MFKKVTLIVRNAVGQPQGNWRIRPSRFGRKLISVNESPSSGHTMRVLNYEVNSP